MGEVRKTLPGPKAAEGETRAEESPAAGEEAWTTDGPGNRSRRTPSEVFVLQRCCPGAIAIQERVNKSLCPRHLQDINGGCGEQSPVSPTVLSCLKRPASLPALVPGATLALYGLPRHNPSSNVAAGPRGFTDSS